MSAVNCSAAGLPLVSSLDVVKHKELHNSDSESGCNQSKSGGTMESGGMEGEGRIGRNGKGGRVVRG